MSGEGFAFAAWVRGMIATDRWINWPGAHGWHCALCRSNWTRLQSAQRTIPE